MIKWLEGKIKDNSYLQLHNTWDCEVKTPMLVIGKVGPGN